jgi:hypothetical protein
MRENIRQSIKIYYEGWVYTNMEIGKSNNLPSVCWGLGSLVVCFQSKPEALRTRGANDINPSLNMKTQEPEMLTSKDKRQLMS